MLLAKEDRSMVPSAFDDISYNLCKRREDVLMMSADLAHYVDLYKVTKDLPDQYVEIGMAEQPRNRAQLLACRDRNRGVTVAIMSFKT